MQEIDNQKSHLKNFKYIIVASVILIIFATMLNQLPWRGTSSGDNLGSTGNKENPWTLTDVSSGAKMELELPKFLEMDSGEIYMLSTQLTYDGTKDEMPYAFLHLDHVYCRVFLDGEQLFSYMPEDVEKWDKSKSPGFIYKAFPLPKDCMGKELKIELLPPFTTAVEYGLPEIEFGDYKATLNKAFLRDLSHEIVIILCIFLGILEILFATVNLRDSNYREGISIGVFALLFALYLITECQLNTFYIDNPYYVYLLNYIPFSLLPIALMGFMRERLPERQTKICTAVIGVGIAFFSLEMVLHFGGILDMREVIPVTHAMYFIEITMVTAFITSMKNRKKRKALVLQLVPVLGGMIVDGIIYWNHVDIGGNDATFTILGVILFLIIELLHAWKSSIAIYTQSVRSDVYRQMAYIDEMTGVSNRRSYDREIDSIVAGEKEYKSIIIVSIDVNRLKYVNDTFGHAEGDFLIKSVAQIMKDVVGAKGLLFRTGGDEFSIFLYNLDLTEYERMYQETKNKINAFNEEHEYVMSLAVGYVEITDHSILEAVQKADKKMYIDKALKKSGKINEFNMALE